MKEIREKLRPVECELTNKQTYIQTHMSDQHTWRNLFRQVIKAPLIIAEIGPDELYRVQTAITRKLLVVRTFQGHFFISIFNLLSVRVTLALLSAIAPELLAFK